MTMEGQGSPLRRIGTIGALAHASRRGETVDLEDFLAARAVGERVVPATTELNFRPIAEAADAAAMLSTPPTQPSTK